MYNQMRGKIANSVITAQQKYNNTFSIQSKIINNKKYDGNILTPFVLLTFFVYVGTNINYLNNNIKNRNLDQMNPIFYK